MIFGDLLGLAGELTCVQRRVAARLFGKTMFYTEHGFLITHFPWFGGTSPLSVAIQVPLSCWFGFEFSHLAFVEDKWETPPSPPGSKPPTGRKLDMSCIILPALSVVSGRMQRGR